MRRPVVIFLFTLLMAPTSYAQSVGQLVVLYANDLNVNSSFQVPVDLLKRENVDSVLYACKPYMADTISIVRSGMFFLISKIGLTSTRTDVREYVVFQLMTAIDDKDAAIAGNALKHLTEFNRNDFNGRSKNLLINTFGHDQAHIDQVIKLIGYLDLKIMSGKIRPYTLPPHNKPDRWAALLALSRMGDQEATQSIMQRVQKLKLSDDVIYEVFPDLIYTRQPAAIDYMITILNSEEKNCLSPNPNSEQPIPCGYRVMEQLAPVIEGYPLKLGPGGDIETTDYPKALQQVRQWFKERGTNYTIRKDTF